MDIIFIYLEGYLLFIILGHYLLLGSCLVVLCWQCVARLQLWASLLRSCVP